MASHPSTSSVPQAACVHAAGEASNNSFRTISSGVPSSGVDDDEEVRSNSNTAEAAPQGEGHVDEENKGLSICGIRRRIRALWVVTASMLLLLIGVALVVAFTVGKRNDGTNPDQQQQTTNDEMSYEDRFKTIRTALANYTDPSDFMNPDTPQSRALDWLVFKDKNTRLDDLDHIVQRYTIMVLFYACSGKDWRSFLTPIDEQYSTNECLFHGMECDDSGSIVTLNLNFQKMAGRLPDEMSLLSKLVYLDLADNLLEGTIPNALFRKLTNLEALALDYNEFASTVSPEIGNLKNLNELRLQNNYFSGELPSSMKQLSNLELLDLSGNNDFTGNVFDLLIHWPRLVDFLIDFTSFSGEIPATIGNYTNLKTFRCYDTLISGTLPADITRLTKLQGLELASRRLGGFFPEQIGELSQLTSLHIRNSHVEGSIPSSISKLTSLEVLALESTLMNRTLPPGMGMLTSLTVLSLMINHFSGTVPSELGNLTNLEKLTISSNDLTGSIDQFCNAKRVYIRYDCKLTCDCCPNTCDDCSKSSTKPECA